MANPGKMSLDQAILHIIGKQAVPDQASLLLHLQEFGFQMTQGTLSRRLAKLSVQKKDGRYERVIPENHPMPPYQMLESPPNLLILQTGPNYGMALAIRVDRSKIPGVAGTLAGEDTLFIALKAGAQMNEIKAHIEAILGPASAN